MNMGLTEDSGADIIYGKCYAVDVFEIFPKEDNPFYKNQLVLAKQIGEEWKSIRVVFFSEKPCSAVGIINEPLQVSGTFKDGEFFLEDIYKLNKEDIEKINEKYTTGDIKESEEKSATSNYLIFPHTDSPEHNQAKNFCCCSR